ncbi:MAG: ABC transporter ATP-binding protein/permease [Flavobacteriales bacterium]|nr:ABC transporter ATP-binding protein/permease [Flavobacteriales bacterium]
MKSLFYLNKYLIKYKWRLLLGTLFIVASNLFGVYMPEVVKNATNQIVDFANQSTDDFSYQEITKLAIYLAGVYVFLSFMKGVFLFFTRQTIIIMSRLIEYDLKNEIYNKYQELDMSFYKKNRTGDIMNRISEDVSRVRMYLGPAIMYTINLIVLFILIVSFMLRINVELTLYSLVPLPIMSYLVYKVSSVINKRSELVQRTQSGLSSFVQEKLSGIRVLKAYNRGKHFVNKFEEETYNYQVASLSLARTNAFFMPVIVLLIGLSTIITIYIGGVKAIEGTIDTGIILQFIMYVNMLTWPFASVGWVTSLVQRAAASQTRLNEFLEVESEITEVENPITIIKGAIEFKNVSFIYPESGIVALDNVSFVIPEGATVGVTGRTGCGKSTIANLLCRLYDVTEGEVLINGTNIKQYSISALRTAFGYVPQEVFLFSDTVANNIAFGMKQKAVSEAAIIQAAKDAAVYQNIIGFEKGFETEIGEKGVTLSGGQKQRLSIARAIIKEPPFMIFDDCLSAVDTKTEEQILSNLNRIMNGKTAVLIGHRISTLKNADQILLFDNGHLLEKGSHNELVNLGGNYAELYQKQKVERKG